MVENLTFGTIWWWQSWMDSLRPIGIGKGIYGRAVNFLVCRTYLTLLFIWRMMPFRKHHRNMEDINLAINYLIQSFSAIWTMLLRKVMWILEIRYFLRWRRLLPMWLRQTIWIWISNGRWIIFRYLVWILWLIVNSNLGLSKLTQILVWRSVAICYRE